MLRPCELGVEKMLVTDKRGDGDGESAVEEWVELNNGCVCCTVKARPYPTTSTRTGVTFHLNLSIFEVPSGDIVSGSRDKTTATTAVTAGGRADEGTS